MSYNFNDYKKFCKLNNLKEGRYNSLRLFKLYIKDLKFELYLIIYNVKTNTEFKKHFKCEFDMDKFIRKIKYVSDISIIEDSREIYFPDYNR